MTEFEGRLFIDGEFTEAVGGRRFEVINPADETVVGTAADATAQDVARAVAAARRAADQTDWGADHALRQQALRRWQQLLRGKAGFFRELQILEAGSPSSALDTQIDGVTEDMSFFHDMICRFPWEAEFPAHNVMGMASNRLVRYEPYGVVGAITPWNAPYMTAIWKINHAISTGNTVVLKTAPDTPLTGAAIAQTIAEAGIPAGVVNIIGSADKAAAGEALTADAQIDMYHFTGSPGVGQRIAERAAVGIRKACLELGGKSANVVLPDADLDQVTALGTMMCMSNSGQGCALATRMVVHASVYGELLARLEASVGSLPWGDPADPVNIVGPIIRAEQVDRMAGLVDRAREAGARVLVGGHRGDRGGKGFWYEPTLVVDVDENAEIAQTEVFGPVLTVVRYDGDDDEALRVANNSRYGLSGYVHSGDPERAWRIARGLRSGTVSIGASFFLSPDTPFGGYGISGIGREHGEDGFREYLQAKTIASPAD